MIIIPDDWRVIAILGVIAAILMVVCMSITDATQPTCPAGSIAKHTRSGWFCVVPEVKQ
jgi:hypothetical protein